MSALFGTSGGYSPCLDEAAQTPSPPEGALVGSSGAFISRDVGAAVLEPLSDGALVGQDGGFVPKPCLAGCIDQTTLGRSLTTSWVFSTTLTPNMNQQSALTPTQRDIYCPFPLDQWLDGVHTNYDFWSYPHNLAPDPYPSQFPCWKDGDPLNPIYQCPPFLSWEQRTAPNPGPITGERPWRTFIGDFVSVGTTFDHDFQWEWQLMLDEWGTGTPTYGDGIPILEGTTSYNEGRKEMPERLQGVSTAPYFQFYIKFKDPPPGSARVQIAITDDAAHENILRQCSIPP